MAFPQGMQILEYCLESEKCGLIFNIEYLEHMSGTLTVLLFEYMCSLSIDSVTLQLML